MDKIMNKRQENMEKMLAMVLLVYGIGLMLGEALRDRMYGSPDLVGEDQVCKPNRKLNSYSGLFILLKHKITLLVGELRKVVAEALSLFNILVHAYVRT